MSPAYRLVSKFNQSVSFVNLLRVVLGGNAAQKRTKTFLTLPSMRWTSLRMTLKRTVLDRGRHWPTVTTSPILMRKAGER